MMNRKLSVAELVLSCISNVLKKKKRCTFGNLIEECFYSYPDVFSLSDHPQWPDTLRLDRPLRKLRDMRYISGSPSTYYLITNSGKQALLSVNSSLISKEEKKKQQKVIRSPLLSNLKEIEKSEDYKEYLGNVERYKPNNMRIRYLTKFTLETPAKALVSYLVDLRDLASERKKSQLTNFINTYLGMVDRGGS